MTRLEEIDQELAALACSDGGCVVRRPSGMHTNGGCDCLPYRSIDWTIETKLRFRRVLFLRQEQVKLLQDQVLLNSEDLIVMSRETLDALKKAAHESNR